MIKKINRQDVYLGLLILFIGSYPATFNLNAMCVVFLAIFFLVDIKNNLKAKFKIIKTNKLVLIFSAYFIVQCLGVLNSTNLLNALEHLNIYLPFLVLPPIIVSEKLDFKKKQILFKIIKIWLVVFLIGLSLVQFFYFQRSIARLNNFAYAYLGTSQVYISSLLYLLLLDSFRKTIQKKEAIINAFYTVFFGYYILLFSSRAVITVLFIALIYLIFIEKPFKQSNNKHKLFAVVLLFAALTLSLSTSNRLKKKVLTFYNTIDFNIETIITKNSITYTYNTIEHRVLIDYLALSIIKENPILGVGTGDFQEELTKKYQEINFKVALRDNLNTHNQYLQEYLKAGIVGFIWFIFINLLLIKVSYKKNHELFYVAVLVAYACFFESYISRQHGVVFVAFFTSFFYNQNKKGLTHKKNKNE